MTDNLHAPDTKTVETHAPEGCRACGHARTRSIGKRYGYNFLECASCGFIFIPAIRREEIEPAYINGKRSIDNGAPETGWAPDLTFLQPAFDHLDARENLRVLDFGCGQSDLPEQLREKDHRVLAVDLEPPARPHPDRRTGDLLDMALDAAQFDLIYSYQVFEHLPEPQPILDELLRLARPGGYLLVHTDMETPERAEGFFDWFYVTPPDHCSYFCASTFEHMLEGRDGELVWSDPWSVLIERKA